MKHGILLNFYMAVLAICLSLDLLSTGKVLSKCENVSVDYAPISKLAEVGEVTLLSSDNTSGVIKIKNKDGRRFITSAEVVLEFHDQRGFLLYSIMFSGSSENSSRVNQPKRPIRTQRQFLGPLGPKQSAFVAGESALTWHACPSKGTVRRFLLKFSDGTEAIYEAPGLVYGPELLDAPPYFSLGTQALTSPMKVPLSLRINSRGFVSGVSFHERLNKDLENQIEAQFKLWRFFSATSESKPIDSILRILLCFEVEVPEGRSRCQPEVDSRFSGPFVLVRLQPRPKSKADWVAFYGGLLASRELVPLQ
jgi:hypothetical protein